MISAQRRTISPLISTGFWHEQSRTDRDDYIEIVYGNIMSSMQYNFQKMNSRQIDLLDTPYDTCSVMHYNAYAFTMVRKRCVRISIRRTHFEMFSPAVSRPADH